MRLVSFPTPDATGGADGIAASAGDAGAGAGRQFPSEVGLDAGLRDGRSASGGGNLEVFGAKATLFAVAASELVAAESESRGIGANPAASANGDVPGGVSPRGTTSILGNRAARLGR